MNGFAVDPGVLRGRSPELGGVAEEIAQIEPIVTGALVDTAVLASAVLSPATALRAQRALLHCVTNPDGMGLALAGSPVADVLDGIGGPGLAEQVAADAVLMRISAVTYEDPELANHTEIDRLARLLADGAQIEAAQLITEDGARLAPVAPELMALSALLDENPLNDPVGWEILRGEQPSTDPVLGLDLNRLAQLVDTGPGHAAPVELPPGVVPQADTGGAVTNLRALGNEGRVLIQEVRGADGVARYAVALPGMRGGPPMLPAPQDLAGAVRNAQLPDSSYTGAVRDAMRRFGVPGGAEVLLVGHSAGGLAAANLAQDPAFNGANYRVTDVITLGSPVDQKVVPEGTRFTSVVNDRDVVPTLDGRGPASPVPVLAGRTELRLDSAALQATGGSDPGAFPASHRIGTYQALLASGDHLRALDEGITRYADGAVVRAQAYQLSDHPPEPV